MEWILVLFLILLGIALVVVEIIFVPGTTIVGIFGVGLAAFGVYQGFTSFGTGIGIAILISTIVVGGVATIYSFKSGVWHKFALKSSIESRVNDEYVLDLQIEQRGVAVSALRPIGKAEFAGTEYEVQTVGEYVDAGTGLKIISIKGRKIFVEPLK